MFNLMTSNDMAMVWTQRYDLAGSAHSSDALSIKPKYTFTH